MTMSAHVNVISCLKWVRKGVAKSNPEKVKLTKEELLEVIRTNKAKLRDKNEERSNNEQNKNVNDEACLPDEYNFNQYDEEADFEWSNIFGLSTVAELPSEEENLSDSDDSEKEDDILKPDDNLLIVGHIDDDASICEVYVCNENEGSLYVHHDNILSEYPLCFEWLDYEPNQPMGNYCAVGSLASIIDVWDLDVINCLEPAFRLGKKASHKNNKKSIGHTDAVLDLSWNYGYHHVLASGSVDKNILLWDLDIQRPHTVINAFANKIQCIEWHKFEMQTLLAGGCDHTAKIFDCRTPNTFKTWELSGDVEKLLWSSINPFIFFVGTNTGSIHSFDCRKGQLWSLEAHTEEVTALSMSQQCPSLLVTSSGDGKIKAWDTIKEKRPKLVFEKQLQIGAILCLEFCPDSPFLVAAGGNKDDNNLAVLDLFTFDEIKNTFGSRDLVNMEVV